MESLCNHNMTCSITFNQSVKHKRATVYGYAVAPQDSWSPCVKGGAATFHQKLSKQIESRPVQPNAVRPPGELSALLWCTTYPGNLHRIYQVRVIIKHVCTCYNIDHNPFACSLTTSNKTLVRDSLSKGPWLMHKTGTTVSTLGVHISLVTIGVKHFSLMAMYKEPDFLFSRMK